jgi:hypothetical protein
MAFTTYSIGVGELHDSKRSKVSSALATKLATGVTSLSAIGGEQALALACAAFIAAWRNTSVDTQRYLSANKTISVQVSSTGALVTVQFQL